MKTERIAALFVALMMLVPQVLAQGAKSPQIVAQVAVENSTDGTSQTIYTPKKSGLFRLSTYLETPTGSYPTNYDLIYFWYFDDDGFIGIGPFYGGLPGNDPSMGPSGSAASWVMRLVADQPVTYQVQNPNNLSSVVPYNLYVTIERLQ